ncbi:B12-binding domain-containing radical SAM protein [Flavicella sediminum]|uniref:B12-binding domain-containing radical SAM protein n=1 Tax=Flavicella sediminum TaxID=2585141 RepID=UPI001123D7A5|nr:B12-binding domain-containing radical SAM protein [Flavicella sediminum]
MTDVLLITPPFTQLNTPYPATAYLKGFLNTKNISCFQMDLGMEVILALFSKSSLQQIFDKAFQENTIQTDNAKRIYALRNDYFQTIDTVVRFLQGKNQTLSRQICSENYLPEANRFQQLDDLDWAFGAMGQQNKAKHLATLYLEDISDFIIECIDENFGFSRYAESIGQSAHSFDPLYSKLEEKLTYIDKLTLAILEERIEETKPKLIGISVPFPGNLYSAFRCAQFIKKKYPEIKVSMGGGFPNTELRSLTDVRVFEFFDYITLDDGELPVELLVASLKEENLEKFQFKRTFQLKDGAVYYNNTSTKSDYKQKDVGTPDYSDLLLDQYISVIEIANPMHSLWSDGRWNKLTMAHGCYWGKCSFCDVSLDYIKIYEPVAAKLLVDRIEEIVAQTGETGFHFVDEAAPPALMRAVALEILKRNVSVTWWTNIRFEKSFTKDLCLLLKASGCIAVSGGLEVASDRLLKLIDKGVTVEQVAQVTHHFTNAGVLVHSYLMYGYPTQTVQETIDSLEMVKQLFELGIIQSGFWHQFSLTAHSPIGLKPANFGITPLQKEISFAHNDVEFKDKTNIKHDKFSYGLKKSIFNFMHGIGFDLPVNDWFEFITPKTSIPLNYIENCLQSENKFNTKPNAKIIWLGVQPEIEIYTKTKRNNSWNMLKMTLFSKTETIAIQFEEDKGLWLQGILSQYNTTSTTSTYAALKKDFELQFEDFELFWFSKQMTQIKENGLLVL